MDYPIFDFQYKSVYSTSIEFKTQINEKQFGKEQRYPVWTYPKRTFVLSFDKNFTDRQKLENFYISTQGGCNKFLFIWKSQYGGNDKTYLCSFDEDSFKQNIFDFGFSDCELTLIAIDDSSVNPVENFDFWHKAECDFSLEYKFFSDFAFSSSFSKKTYQSSPKRKWTLSFQKNSIVRKQFEDFFIAKRGRFRSFKWTWALDKGGDGQTYNVRFNNDELNLSVFEFGYGEFQIDLIEVFPSENPLSEVEKDEIIPRKLLKIELDSGSVYILDNETLDSLDFNGETYIGAPLSHGEIKNDDNSSVNKLEIDLSNVNLAISSIIANRGDVITNSFAVLTLVFLNVNTNEIIQGLQKILYSGRCNNLSLDLEKASIDIETELGGYEKLAPVIKYRPSCQVRRFKDYRCGYSGEKTTCDRTFSTCSELGNTINFRGFPSCVLETVIKV
jgi:phage-related protein